MRKHAPFAALVFVNVLTSLATPPPWLVAPKKRKKKIQASQHIHGTWVPASAVSLTCLVLLQLHWTPHFSVAVIPSATLPAALPQHLALCFVESFLILPTVSAHRPCICASTPVFPPGVDHTVLESFFLRSFSELPEVLVLPEASPGPGS